MITAPMARFRLLVAGNAVSSYGSFLNTVALNLYAYQLTGSALRSGLYLMLGLGAGALAGLAAGRLGDRFAHRRVMIGANVVQAAALCGFVAAPAASREVLLYCLALVSGVCGTMFAVALRSAVPAIVGTENRQRANGLIVTGRAIAMVTGFASAGTVIAWFDYRTAFLVDAATFLVSAATILTLRFEVPRGDPAAPAASRRRSRRALGSAALALVGVYGVVGVGSGSFQVALPPYSTTVDPDDPALFLSWFWTAWAVGNILAHQAVSRLAKRRPVGARGFILGVVVMSLVSVLAFAGLPLWPTLAAAAVTGTASGLAEIAYASRLQALPDEARTRAFGVSISIQNAGFAAGMGAAALTVDAYGPLAVVGVLSAIGAVTALAALALGAARPHRPERTEPVERPAHA